MEFRSMMESFHLGPRQGRLAAAIFLVGLTCCCISNFFATSSSILEAQEAWHDVQVQADWNNDTNTTRMNPDLGGPSASASTNFTTQPTPTFRHQICRTLSASSNGHSQAMSVSQIWRANRQELKNALYYNDTKHSESPNEKFRSWASELFDWYTPDRMRRSLAFPASDASMRKILQVIEDYPTTKEPLSILVMGGSVTAGVRCLVNTIEKEEKAWKSGSEQRGCAWPKRFEVLFNKVFFGGQQVVKVTSLARGGANSKYGAFVVDSHRFPKKMHLPHIVISAYSANDFLLNDEKSYTNIQDFVQAAFRLRKCDDDLPMVAMVDDFYGVHKSMRVKGPSTINEQSARVSTISSWYHLMHVSYANVVKHGVYGRMEDKKDTHPLVSSAFQNDVHLGMGFHMGVSWVVLFSFLNAIVETCNDVLSEELDNYAADRSLPVEELPSKYISRLGPADKDQSFKKLSKQWHENTAKESSRCKSDTAGEPDGCEFSWMVEDMEGGAFPEHIESALRPVLTSRDGWNASGSPTELRRPGWYADKVNATFSLEFKDVAIQSKFLTMLHLKSYTGGFVGSNVKVEMEVIHKGSDEISRSSSERTGDHDSETSEHFPHKMKLPGDGAKVGDTVRATFTLVSGYAFKISGIVMCSR